MPSEWMEMYDEEMSEAKLYKQFGYAYTCHS